MKTDIKSCRATGPTQTKALDNEAIAQGASGNQIAPLKLAVTAEPQELFAFNDWRDLLRTRLTQPLLKVFAQLTGLRLHVLWHSPLAFLGLGAMLVLCPMARRRASANGQRPKCCASCLRRRWKPALSSANRGRRFIGQCGVTNFCANVQVGEFCPLTLVLQARVTSRSPSCQSADRERNKPVLDGGHIEEPISRAGFQRAVSLVRLILRDLESTAQAQAAKSELEDISRRLRNAQTEVALLRGELRRRLPDFPESTVQPILGNHARQLVEAMRDHVHQHYNRPMNLKELASAMNMNASYLSNLFHQTTSVPFHRFLEEVRLSKAKELLRDPRNRICGVACATGYASPDAFRHAFKAHEGLSPEIWRSGQ